MTPTAWDFQNQLTAILNAARQIGKSYVDVESGNLHRQVGGYPDSNHRMPVCCEVMRRMMRGQDVGSGFLLYRQSFTFSVMWLHGRRRPRLLAPGTDLGSGLSCCTLGCYCFSVSSSLFLLSQTF